MKKLPVILILILVLFSNSCFEKSAKEIRIEDNDVLKNSKFSPPRVIQLDKKKLQIITPGEHGIPLPVKIQLSKPIVHSLPNQPVFPGVSYLAQSMDEIEAGDEPKMSKRPIVVQLDSKKLLRCTPGEQGFLLPVVYHVEKTKKKNDFVKNYSVQYGDTIYPPIFKTYPEPISKPASMPKYRDNASKNIQIIGADGGLTSSIIFSVMEDSRGNVWFGTFEGATCYDGTSFKTFTVNEGLNHNFVSSIYEDKSGKIWFSHQMANAGVSCYDGQQFCHYTTSQGLSGNAVNSVLEDKKGNIWFGTENGLTCYNEKTFTNYSYKQGLCYNLVLDLLEDKAGNLWIATLGGISIFNGKSFVDLTLKNGFFKANSMIEDKKGNIWFTAYGLGLIKFDGNFFTHYTEEQGLISNKVVMNNNLVEDEDGNIWVGTENGINCFDGKSFSYLTVENGLSSNIITALYKDSGGNIWIGTRGDGVNCYFPNSFAHFTKQEGLPLSTVRAIYEDKSGNIWIGTWGGGVSCFDGINLKNYDLSKNQKGPAHNDVRSIIEDEKGNLWFGTGNGLKCFDGENLLHYGVEQGLPDHGIVHLYVDRKGNIWIGTWEGGLSCWNGKSFTNYQSVEEIGKERVRPMFEDEDGNLWLSSWGNGISKFDGKEFVNYSSEQGLVNNYLYSIAETKYGGILAGTEGSGLSYFVDNKFFNYGAKEGLCHGLISSIKTDQHENIWVGTMNGLSFVESTIFSKELVGNWANCPECAGMNYTFGTQDGLKSTGVYQNALFVDSKSRLWVGTNKALSVLDLNKYSQPESATEIQLNSIKVNGISIDFRSLKQFDVSKNANDTLYSELTDNLIFDSVASFFNYPVGLQLPYKFNHLTFHFSGIDWKAPHKIVYQYKLDGLEKNWSQTGSENIADYRNIPYGNYIFKIRARGASGKWSNIFCYRFIVKPPWWYSWWAKGMYLLLLVLAVYLIIKWRTAVLVKRQKQLEYEVEIATKEIKTQKEIVEEKNIELFAQNEEITTQRDQIEKQHNSITDSIFYARRIQTAVLPRKEYIDEILPENFILFKPRDIVSGDFYWVKQIDGKIVIAAVDCTGHGVPGSIMSMLGVSFITEIVQKQHLLQADLILNELRSQIKQALRQTSKKDEVFDGMDMALCILDTHTQKLEYAGAMNPLYLIQNKDLKIIKADRMPIGYYPKEKPGFVKHEIQLNRGDIFYLFSDGYMDQFGGKDGSKYKASNFRKILLENHEKPMHEQKKVLLEDLEEWMNGHSQTDDILVMGVKV